MTNTKACPRCSTIQSLDQFGVKGKHRQTYCKLCSREVSREYYRNNRQLHISNVRANNKELMDQFYSWKKTLCCVSCGETHAGCLQFHHIDPTQKDFAVGTGSYATGRRGMIKEILKCVVVCGNCHVKIHDGVLEGSSFSTITEAVITF